MTSSLRIKKFKTDKFDYFSGDINYNFNIHKFRDVISLIINQLGQARASGGHFLFARRASEKQAKRAYKYIYSRTRLVRTPPGSGKSTY